MAIDSGTGSAARSAGASSAVADAGGAADVAQPDSRMASAITADRTARPRRRGTVAWSVPRRWSHHHRRVRTFGQQTKELIADRKGTAPKAAKFQQCSMHQLPCQRYLHRVAILVQDIEPRFRHVAGGDCDTMIFWPSTPGRSSARSWRSRGRSRAPAASGRYARSAGRPVAANTRCSRLEEHDGREFQQVQAGFHQLGIGDEHVDAAVQLLGDPVSRREASTLARNTATLKPSCSSSTFEARRGVARAV